MNELHRFLFDGLPVRGSLVRLGDGWQELLARRSRNEESFAPAVRELLGEMAAAGVLMHSNIKFNGALVLQMHGDGPVKIAVVEVQPDLNFRATAKVNGDVAPDARLEALLNVHGKGRCAITLDPRDRLPGQQPYQGIVPLHGDRREALQNLSEVLEHYMLQSEQLDTRLVLAADDQLAAGLLIQRLPVEGAGNLEHQQRNEDAIGHSEDFNRIAHLASSLSRRELLTLDADTILRRLFWQEPLLRFEPLLGSQQATSGGLRFACTCSRERVGSMLLGLGRDEVDSILAEQGRALISCDFCGTPYVFDPVDVGELFTPPSDHVAGNQTLN